MRQVPLAGPVFFLRVLIDKEVNSFLDASVTSVNFEPALEGSANAAGLFGVVRVSGSESSKLS